MLNEFERKYRPALLDHLPPLSSSQVDVYSEKPKIVQRGALTLSMPVKNRTLCKGVSNLIGNNYSPLASTFSTKDLYDRAQHGASDSSGPDRAATTSVTTMSSGGGDLQSLRYQSKSVATFRTDQPRVNRRKAQNAMVGKHSKSVSAMQEAPPSGWRNGGGRICSGNRERQRLSRLAAAAMPLPWEEELLDGDGGFGGGRIKSEKRVLVSTGVSPDPREQTAREPTDAERAALSVDFPPWFASTSGLSRPSSPSGLEQELRYEQLVRGAFQTDAIAPLADEWLAEIRRFTGPLAARPELRDAADTFLQVRANSLISE